MYNNIQLITFDSFIYQTMYIMFVIAGILYKMVASARVFFFSYKKIFLKKLLYIKNILKKISKKVFYTIFFNICNISVTILFFSLEIFKNSKIFFEKSLEFRKEIVDEMKYTDEFGGDENFSSNYYTYSLSF